MTSSTGVNELLPDKGIDVKLIGLLLNTSASVLHNLNEFASTTIT